MIKGKIIENKINEYIKIELQGGSILTYTYDQIESIEREEVNSNSSNSNACVVRKLNSSFVYPKPLCTNAKAAGEYGVPQAIWGQSNGMGMVT